MAALFLDFCLFLFLRRFLSLLFWAAVVSTGALEVLVSLVVVDVVAVVADVEVEVDTVVTVVADVNIVTSFSGAALDPT